MPYTYFIFSSFLLFLFLTDTKRGKEEKKKCMSHLLFLFAI